LARRTGWLATQRASVEIRTVNHRFFSPNLKLPAAFTRWEGEIRELLRQKIARGHVTLTARIDRDSTAPVIDETRLAQYLTALKALQKKHKLAGELDLSTLLRLPDVIGAPSDEIDPGDGDALVRIVAKAADNLTAMRRAEGAQLSGFLLERSGGRRIQARADRETRSGAAQGAARPRQAHRRRAGWRGGS